MTKTTVGTDLLQALQVITQLGVDTVGEDLRVLAIDNVALTVKEPLLQRMTVSDSSAFVGKAISEGLQLTVGIL